MTTSNTLTKTDLTNILNEIVAIDGTDMTSQEIEDFVDSLNITSINAVDYVVEEGTDSGWTYRKWNSGAYDAWRSDSTNVAVSTAYGSLYRSAEATIAPPSFNVGNGYSISGSVNGGESIWFLTTGADTIKYYQVAVASRSASSRAVKIYLYGTWE